MSHLNPEQLEALASGASAEMTSQQHVASCPECRDAVRLARGRQKLLKGLTPYTLSDVAFRRVEARLDEAVREGLPSATPWWRWLGFGAVALAAAAVLIVTVRTPGDSTDGVVQLPAPKVTLAQVAFRPLTMVQGAKVQRREADAWAEVKVGDVLASGAALSADALTLSDEQTEWAFAASGALSLGGAATVTVGAGQVIAKTSAPVTVLASTRAVQSAAALFSVTRVGAEVVLAVQEGQVEVVDASSGERRVVKAPSALRFSDGASLAEGREEPFVAFTAPVVPARPWTRFDGTALAAGTRVSLDGTPLGTAPFSALVTAGRRRLMLAPPNAASTESWADLVGGQAFIGKVELPEKTDGPEPTADALARLHRELGSQTPKLAACYEKWLKANPTAQGEVTLELTVNAQGKVRRATLGANTISSASAECLVRTARSLVLSPLGAEATLEVPLVLRGGH